MPLTVVMLKKFNEFFTPSSEIDMSFKPYVVQINGVNLHILQASDADIPHLLKLEQAVYSGRTPWDRFSFESELQKHANSLYLVAYAEDELVAFIGARFIPSEAHITNIAVNPKFQRRGIGTYLLGTVIDRANRNRSDQVTLEVRADNDTARRVYQRLGFKDNFVRKNYYLSDHLDGISMILKLKE